MNPLAVTGLTVGGIALAHRFNVATPSGTGTDGGGDGGVTGQHVSTEDYRDLIAWARSEYGYKTTQLTDMVEEERLAALAVWGPISTDDKVPARDIASCISVLNRWAAIGEAFGAYDLMIGGNRNGEAPGAQFARVKPDLDELRHVRNQLLSDPDANLSPGEGRVDNGTCKETLRLCERLAVAVENEGDFFVTDPKYDWGYLDYVGDQAQDVVAGIGKGAGTIGAWLGGIVGELGLGALKGLVTSPAGAAVLLVGGYLVYRRVA